MINLSQINYEGNISILNDNSLKLGIVGSRSIINYTKTILEELFYEIRNFNFCIVSGGMYGVDMLAHNLALKHNLKTICVLPQGIENYKNSSLYNQLRVSSNSQILFISKYLPNENPRKYTYIERNKVISEVSEVLLVAQASNKSGSISTANHTIKLKKKLISVPFSLEHSQFQGTNTLIQRGADIYLNPYTVLENFGINPLDVEKLILSLVSSSPQSFDFLRQKIDIHSDLIKKSLLKLILEGQIFYDGEKYFL